MRNVSFRDLGEDKFSGALGFNLKHVIEILPYIFDGKE